MLDFLWIFTLRRRFWAYILFQHKYELLQLDFIHDVIWKNEYLVNEIFQNWKKISTFQIIGPGWIFFRLIQNAIHDMRS